MPALPEAFPALFGIRTVHASITRWHNCPGVLFSWSLACNCGGMLWCYTWQDTYPEAPIQFIRVKQKIPLAADHWIDSKSKRSYGLGILSVNLCTPPFILLRLLLKHSCCDSLGFQVPDQYAPQDCVSASSLPAHTWPPHIQYVYIRTYILHLEVIREILGKTTYIHTHVYSCGLTWWLIQ